MTKYELKKYIYLRQEAEELKQQAEQTEDEIKSLRASILTGMPRSEGYVNDKIGALIVKLEQKKEEYVIKYRQALVEKEKIEQIIESLSKPSEKQIMQERYIQGKKWEDICEDMHYSWRHIHRLHAGILIRIKDL